MTRKILSIITVTKNCVNTIGRTLKSIQALKSDDVEYIFIDGLSKDGTLEVIKTYSEIIDVFISEADTGIYNAMNKGVIKARGEFILFINGDDEIIPDGVKKILTILPHCKEQVLCATTQVVGDQINPSFSYIPDPHKLVYWASVPHPSSFTRRELLIQNPFREDLKIASDYDFFLKIFLAGASFKIVPYSSALHYYGGISSNTNKANAEKYIILKQHLGCWRAKIHIAIPTLWRWAKVLLNKIQGKQK